MYQPAIIALFGLATRCCSRALQGRATTSYDVEIPSTASVVSDWESLYGEVEKYPETVLVSKYGGWVVEVDQTIVLAADDGFIQEITEADVVEEDEEPECEEVEEEDEDGNLVKRCNHSRCFMHATCRSYTGCYVCRIYNPNTGGGHCI